MLTKAMPQSLVGRLVFFFFLPSFTIVAVVASIAYLSAIAALEDSVLERLDAVATVKASAFGAWVGQLYRGVVLVSQLPELATSVAELSGEDTTADRREAAYRWLADFFAVVLKERSGFTEILILAPVGGEVLFSTDRTSEGDVRIYDRYYTEGRKAPYVQNVYPSPLTLRPTLTIGAPLKTREGETVGVLAAHLALDYLDRNILQRIGLGRTGVVTLVDRHKVLVTGQHYGDEAAASAAESIAVEEVIRGESGGGLYRDLAGAEVIGVYRWLEDQELGLIVETLQDEALAPARRLALSILGVGLVCVVALAGGIYVVARRLARPILAITTAAAQVRRGDLSGRAPVWAGGEIGHLARTFNRMVEQLATDLEERRRAAAERETLIAELEAKNEELERFTYTVSHDLKSPLMTITGFLGYVEEAALGGDRERLRADLGRISNAADRMRQLLDELLELSRIGRKVHPPEEIPLAELAREVVDSIVPLTAQRRVAVDIEPDLPTIRGDRVRLRELFENLLENAIKFSADEAVPKVTIGSRRDGDETVVFVRDNGVGIDAKYHEKVFGLFERLDPETEGTGIGLAIVRRVVEIHGGRIWVESEGEGRGSTLCFVLDGETRTEPC